MNRNYDLEKDPAEQKTLLILRAYGTTVQLLKKELINRRNQYDDYEPAGELN